MGKLQERESEIERGGSALIYSAKALPLSLVKPPFECFQASFGMHF